MVRWIHPAGTLEHGARAHHTKNFRTAPNRQASFDQQKPIWASIIQKTPKKTHDYPAGPRRMDQESAPARLPPATPNKPSAGIALPCSILYPFPKRLVLARSDNWPDKNETNQKK